MKAGLVDGEAGKVESHQEEGEGEAGPPKN